MPLRCRPSCPACADRLWAEEGETLRDVMPGEELVDEGPGPCRARGTPARAPAMPGRCSRTGFRSERGADLVTQLCPTDSWERSPPGSSVRGTSQARTPECEYRSAPHGDQEAWRCSSVTCPDSWGQVLALDAVHLCVTDKSPVFLGQACKLGWGPRCGLTGSCSALSPKPSAPKAARGAMWLRPARRWVQHVPSP